MDTRELGYFGENLAARYLENLGYTIIDRNFEKSFGEIDLIARKDNTIYFIEVKTNKREYGNMDFNPEIRVNKEKVSHITKVATFYMSQNKHFEDYDWQIDIISVIINEVSKKAKIKHFKNIASDIW